MTPPPPRVTREIKSPTFERAPPPVLFGYDPDEDGASSVARFVRGDPVAPPSRDRTYPLYVRRSALARMLDESTSAQPLEAMGLLAGARYEWRGQTYAIVRDAVTGERTIAYV
ncbi:MAG TPA: hypothetical protein VM681_04240 [Candidatus Thermoplasmatota archaeon]|nr:hypothetical protein [Candidatus Thermoplasmatota archaeon]